jgi:hypothetical protein
MEKDWTQMFKVEQVEKPFHIETEAGECNSNCQLAKEIKCVCRCGGKNHGVALKKNVKCLDEFTTVALVGPVGFEPTTATREELAVLA